MLSVVCFVCGEEGFSSLHIALECSRVIVKPQAVFCALSMSLMHTTICLILTFSSGLASILLCPKALRFYMKEAYDY